MSVDNENDFDRAPDASSIAAQPGVKHEVDVGEAPDVATGSSKAGMGVRRLNNKPLLLIGGCTLLLSGALAYTVVSRGGDDSGNGGSPAQQLAQAHGIAGGAADTVSADIPKLGAVCVDPTPTSATPSPSPLASASAAPANQPQPSAKLVCINGHWAASSQSGTIVTKGSGNDTAQTSPNTNGANAPVATQARQVPSELQERWKLIDRIRNDRITALQASAGASSAAGGFSHGGGQSSGSIAPGSASAFGDPSNVMNRIQQFAAAAGAGQGAGAMPQGMPANSGSGGTDPNGQNEKRGFVGKSTGGTTLGHTREAALSPNEITAGTVIPAVMVGGINSDLPGQIIGQVRQNVYDSATGKALLIPAGAKLVGIYDSSVTHGQKRVLVAWTRIIYPDSSSVSLDGMPGVDQAGYAGYRDKVHSHFGQVLLDALLLSGFTAGIQLSQPQDTSTTLTPSAIATAALGQQLGQLGMETFRQGMNVQPTIIIQPGYRFNVMVTKDVVLPRWSGSGR